MWYINFLDLELFTISSSVPEKDNFLGEINGKITDVFQDLQQRHLKTGVLPIIEFIRGQPQGTSQRQHQRASNSKGPCFPSSLSSI